MYEYILAFRTRGVPPLSGSLNPNRVDADVAGNVLWKKGLCRLCGKVGGNLWRGDGRIVLVTGQWQ
jgi:hypothetical protein